MIKNRQNYYRGCFWESFVGDKIADFRTWKPRKFSPTLCMYVAVKNQKGTIQYVAGNLVRKQALIRNVRENVSFFYVRSVNNLAIRLRIKCFRKRTKASSAPTHSPPLSLPHSSFTSFDLLNKAIRNIKYSLFSHSHPSLWLHGVTRAATAKNRQYLH